MSMWLYLNQQSIGQLHTELLIQQQRNHTLSEENQDLKKEARKQARKLETQQHFLNIQKVTDQQLQLQLKELQDKVVNLNKELIFYQNFTLGISGEKLQIRELHLRADDLLPDIFRYRLVITQGKDIKKPITGTIQLTLNQRDSDNNAPLNIGEHELRLRHVQVFEGKIKLADNMVPDNITVTLKQNNKIALSKTFDWLPTATH
ncbi:MAG: hypothetical protein OEY48_02830 [Gammaproteobacteria bacterium]|nr:hypothetical protein [Gammaproteobacteria bacterium]